jgi:hypothetical protein
MGAWVWRCVALCAGVLFTLLAGAAARRETPTIDEFAHLPAGCVYWKQGAFELYDKNPPLARLWMALPVVLDPQAKIPSSPGPPWAGRPGASASASWTLTVHASSPSSSARA